MKCHGRLREVIDVTGYVEMNLGRELADRVTCKSTLPSRRMNCVLIMSALVLVVGITPFGQCTPPLISYESSLTLNTPITATSIIAMSTRSRALQHYYSDWNLLPEC